MITTSNLDKAKSEIKKSIPPIFFGATIGFLFTLSEIYNVFFQGQVFSQEGIGITFSLLAGILLFMVPVMLKRESKHALTFIILALCFGYARGIFIDKNLTMNFMTISLLFIFVLYVSRFVIWIRAGALR